MALQQIANTDISSTGTFALGSVSSSALTSGRVTYATTGGLLTDSASLTYNGTILTSAAFSGALNGTVGATTPSTVVATSVTNSGLTSGRITYAGASGLLSDSSTLTYDGTTLTTPRLALGGTTLPSAGTATLFLRSSDNSTYLQTGSGNNIYFLDGSQNTMLSLTPTSLAFQISNAAKLTLNSTTLHTANGISVGIGTDSPYGLLNIKGSNGQLVLANGNTSGGMKLTASNSTYTGNGYLAFEGYANEYGRFDSSGNFGIGATSLAANLHISKSTTATVMISNISTTLVTDDAMGLIDFSAGSSNTVNARISGLVVGTSEAGGSLAIETRTDGGSLTEKFRITGAGNVGIGTSSPRAVLDVSTGTTQNSVAVVIGPTSGTATLGNAIKLGFALQNTAGGGTGNTIAAGIGGIQDASGGNTGALGFYTQSSAGDGTPERMRITNAGNVGIGTTDPQAKLTVKGQTHTAPWFAAERSSSTTLQFKIVGAENTGYTASTGTVSAPWTNVIDNNNSDFMISTVLGGGTGGKIILDGKVGIGTSSPNQKLTLGSSDGTQALSFVTSAYLGDNALIGNIEFSTNGAGGGYDNLVNIKAYKTGTNTNSGDLTFWTKNDGSVSEKVRINKSGQVGIGTTDPIRPLQIGAYGGGNGEIAIASGTSGWGSILFGDGSSGSDFYRGYIQYQHSGDYMLFSTATAERMRIDSSGNLGIGTTSPSTFGKVAIQVTGSTTPTTGANVGPASVNMYVGANGGTGSTTGFFGWFDGTPGLGAGMGITRESSGDWGTALRFFNHPSATSNIGDITERMRIDSSGNLLVGTTSQIGAIANRVVIKFDNNNFYGLGIGGSASGTAGMVNFYNSAGTEQGYISTTGSGSTTYSTSSDYRLKENIVPMTGALAKVAQLKPVTYKWKADGSDGQGFIAHELAEVIPDCVSREKDAVDADGKPVYQGVDTSFLVATLTAAIQEQQALIESMATKLKDAGVAGF